MLKVALALALLLAAPARQDKPLRLGIVGLDTSHVVAFTQLLNDEKNPNHIPGAKVVCACKGGSPDIPKDSIGRIDGFTKTLQEKYGVEIVDTIPALCEKVDAVLIESVDGRPHLEQARQVFAAKKRVFIDKPLAGTYKDGVEIARLSKESGTPFFSASSFRFSDSVVRTKNDPSLGKILGCEASSPCSLEPHHPDLFWYGVHGVEALFTIMGPGCESVHRVASPDFDVVVGKWKDGRLGTFRGVRRGSARGATIYGEKAVLSTLSVQAVGNALKENKLPAPKVDDGYRNLVVEIVKFLKGGEPPVSVEEMLEVLAFMQAADVSKEKGGAEVRLDSLK